ncbi:MAG TPA: hypothetical protein VLB44_26420 [Kofleriaceae bacterium]|nr:hypothetical protein [Kofleriaceae bacterium]
MRWALVGLLIAGCTTDTADVPATVVHVNVLAACADCYADLYGMCGYNLPVLDGQPHVKAATELDLDRVGGLVQIQYGGLITPEGGELPRSDYVLAEGEPADVYALYDLAVLYRIDGLGGVTDIDTTRLTSASGSTLHFEYMGNAEEHVIDAPRTVNIETVSSGPCCSAGRPHELGIALLLVTLRRRRRSKLRA